ncbi:PREDICTED: uncharacterized protein LOC107186650 [Dufourea novaeangliae]|uniref:RNA-binding protein 12 n=1 Tax=Dufourea novaeangliae TaxID=178035 RepID=A0A154P8U0_DUFNO|nr:PREDICTED: uncharacterized protein LOC107186650 [Dufourea novaeangliae]XP_015430058.1 PREDICTED: uncharacterized protein LOC107186650 [Dufourea novaeangliae]KZC08261.1 RNA-binding protein 12 [Dufourea novaeangliae]
MSVIIRLQNLAWSANALDIRQFFRGLSIPEGGVHIVGGELGDAFIAFSTDEDARQAMMHDGGKIKEMKIKLLLSSRTEMQKVIEAARQQTLSLQSFMQTAPVAVPAVVQKPGSPGDRRDKEKDNDSESGKDRKDRRDRSRSRERSRSRDRDRDRDRRDRDRGRDRRRRDRSRSRDRERDRRDRRRRRDRSRSRDRTRSRDRDTKRSSTGERRKDTNEDDNNDVVCVGQFHKDKPVAGGAKKPIENGIWEVPPQTQMQAAAMLAPGILGAGVAALSQDGEQRPMTFSSSVIGQQPLLQQSQFPINGINGVGGLIQSHVQSLGHTVGISSLTQSIGSSSLPSLTSGVASLNRPKESWSQSEPTRLDQQVRFAGRSTGQFGTDVYGANNGSMNYRPGIRPNNPFINKMQELEGRRNPHAFQSNNSNQYSFDNERQGGGGGGGGGGGRGSSNSSSRFSSENKSTSSSGGHCVEVRNMPLSATYNDVRHAFQGIYIRKDGLKLINDNHGNRVGIAYVKFSKAEGKELSLSTPRYVRGSEVEVLHLDESIFDKAVDSYSPEKEDSVDDVRSSSCIVLTDLPSFTKEMDIANLFQDWKINDLFITSAKETGNVQAYVQFARIEDAKASVNTSLKIGSKSVTATAITEEKFAQAKRDHEQNSMSQTVTSDCVIMRGLPFQTIDRDICDFFSDIGIVPDRIHRMFNQNSKPTGECFCEFDTADEALRATAKNGLPFGKNVPTIELVPRAKMLELLSMVDPQIMETQQQHFPPLQEQRPRFSGPINHLPRFGNSGSFGPRCPPGLMGMPPRHLMGRHPGSMDYVEGFGKPGCVLSLENVPFKADINEIIEFFGDFDVKRENVIRRYNERGMPTGDARVAFLSPNEAQRALRELKHCKMRDRTIYMKLA